MQQQRKVEKMQSKNELIEVSGVDLFFYETTVQQIKNIADKIGGNVRGNGDEWCITRMFLVNMQISKHDIANVLNDLTQTGKGLAEEFGGNCSGCEIYVSNANVDDLQEALAI